ncbi:hypothetical protein G6F32_013378 [Rhizopus arrhizus]|nr:hypothetical protein G6F32_013378 [Rhizopus arrhizus]
MTDLVPHHRALEPELEVVVHVEGHRRVELAAVLAVLQGLVAGAVHRTAGLARGALADNGGAVVQACDVGAAARIHHQQLVVCVGDDGEVVRRHLCGVADRVVLLGDVTLVAPDRAAVFDLHVDQRVEAVVERVEALGCAEADGAAAAFGVGAATDIQRAAVHALLQDDVDYAGNGVRTVQRGLAARQDFDAVDDIDRDAADVVERVAAVVQRRVGQHRAAIDQVLGVARVEAEHPGRFGALGERCGGLAALQAASSERGLLQHFGNAGEAARLDRLGADANR